MWFIIILIVVVIVVKVKKTVDKAKNEQLDRERIEKKKKAQTEAKARFEVMTDAEKQKLLACGEDVLSTTLNAFDKAIKGDANAMLLIAITYQAKIQNAQKSAYWMQKSSDAGSSDAKYWLGEFYVSGFGVPQDRVEGVSLIIEAARKGNKKAIQSLKESGMSVAEMRSVGIPV